MARDMKAKALQDQQAREKFKTHKGEFVPVTEVDLQGKKVELYQEYKDETHTQGEEVNE